MPGFCARSLVLDVIEEDEITCERHVCSVQCCTVVKHGQLQKKTLRKPNPVL